MNKTICGILTFVSGLAAGIALTAHVYDTIIDNHHEPDDINEDDLYDIDEDGFADFLNNLDSKETIDGAAE